MFRFIGGIFRWIFRMFRNAVAVIGTLVALAIVLAVLGAIWSVLTDKGIPKNTVIAIDARQGFSETGKHSFLGETRLSFPELIFALKKASDDARVKGIIMRVGDGGVEGAHAEELKQALDAFRAKQSGRFVIAQASTFAGPGVGQYYLASLADEIWLQQTSDVAAVGLLSQTIFVKGLLDKIQAKPEIGQRYEYKNAANMFTETDYTPAHREATTHLLQSIYETLTTDIAPRRKLDVAALRAAIESGPHLTPDAVNVKLVDKVGFYDDAERAAKDRAGDKAGVVKIEDYFEHEGSPYDHPFGNDGTVALVVASGEIVDGQSTADFYNGDQLGGDSLADAIHDAADDASVRAILLRVDSPGGSVLASDEILDALRKAQAKGKKVVVSMSGVAASGGYFISMYADKIFADKTTITGSIGVLGGKLALGDTYRMVGLNPAEIGIGANANIASSFDQWTPEQRAKFESGLDAIYARFTQSVAEGRKIPLEEVQQFAKGRVWTGADAMGLKLIDQFGTLSDALDETIRIAGLDPAKRINVRVYPEVSSWGHFFASMTGAASTAEKLQAFGRAVDSEAGRALLQVLDTDRQIRTQPIRMPDVEVK